MRKQKKSSKVEDWKKENLNKSFLSFCCNRPLLLLHCGSAGAFSPLGSFHQIPLFLLLSPNPPPSCTHRQTHRHTPCWYQSKQSQWKSIIVLCHGNLPSCGDGVGWVCASRANIITVRFPHVEIWSVQRSGSKNSCCSRSGVWSLSLRFWVL